MTLFAYRAYLHTVPELGVSVVCVTTIMPHYILGGLVLMFACPCCCCLLGDRVLLTSPQHFWREF